MSAKARKQKKSAAAPDTREIRLSQHPRARRQIRTARAWGALAGFGLAFYASWHGGAPFYDAVGRALLWGTGCYLVVWACAQQIWRQLAIAELRAAERIWLERQTRELADDPATADAVASRASARAR